MFCLPAKAALHILRTILLLVIFNTILSCQDEKKPVMTSPFIDAPSSAILVATTPRGNQVALKLTELINNRTVASKFDGPAVRHKAVLATDQSSTSVFNFFYWASGTATFRIPTPSGTYEAYILEPEEVSEEDNFATCRTGTLTIHQASGSYRKTFDVRYDCE